jgi:hypothetical protein
VPDTHENVPADQPSVTAVCDERIRPHGTADDGRHANHLDVKITAPGIITAEPHGNGGWWLIRIGRNRGEKRFNLTRNEAAELVRVLTRDVLTAAELPQ